MRAGKAASYKGKNPREYLRGWLDGYETARNAAKAFGIDIENPSTWPDSLQGDVE